MFCIFIFGADVMVSDVASAMAAMMSFLIYILLYICDYSQGARGGESMCMYRPPVCGKWMSEREEWRVNGG